MPEIIAQDPFARREWLDIVPELLSLGVLFPIDRALLQAYCSSHSIWVRANRDVAERGMFVDEPIIDRNGKVTGSRRRRNPAVGIAKDYAKLCNSFLLEYGLSFAARRRMGIETGGAPEEIDPLDAYLKRKFANTSPKD